MNLWSLDGTGNQLQLNDDERIEVIIDSFSYQKSGETHVPDGGSCVKHCQCSSNSECDAGTCKAVSTSDGDSDTDTTDEPDDSETDTTDNTDTTGSAACSAHPDCAHLADDCCPNASGDYLYWYVCCFSFENIRQSQLFFSPLPPCIVAPLPNRSPPRLTLRQIGIVPHIRPVPT